MIFSKKGTTIFVFFLDRFFFRLSSKNSTHRE